MDVDYHALLPELILGATVVAVLAVDLLGVEKYWAGTVGLLGLIGAAVPLLTLGVLEESNRTMFGGSYVVDDFALVLKALFIVSGFVSLLLSVGYIEGDRYYQGEFYFLLLASVLGAVVMASARDLITIFIGLELVSGPAFLLAGWRKGDVRSNEAALKFFIIGVLSSAIMLFGMSLVYGSTGEITFAGIREATVGIDLADAPALTLGVLFTLVGFGFKVSAVPFHFWAPDTYQGAPTPVAAYLSVGSKTAGFVGLLVLAYLAFAELTDLWGPALWILAAASMTVGNLAALRQTNLVRLLGYSSVAQGGFILVPFAMAATFDSVGLADAFEATVVYLLIYAFMNLGAFAVAISGARRTGSGEIEDWAGLWSYAPGLAALLAVFFMSLAGIPPLAGWFAKFVMFRAVLGAGEAAGAVLAAIAAVNAVIALYYYARVTKTAFFDPAPEALPTSDQTAAVGPPMALALALTAAAVVVVGVFPQILAFFGEASRVLALGP